MTTTATRRTGIIADGVVKVLLAGAYTISAAPLGDRLGVAAWLMVVCGAALLIAGGIEIGYVHKRPVRTYTRLMAAYDVGWVSATIAGLLLSSRGGSAGGEVWIGYQTAAPIALLPAAAPVQATSGAPAADRSY